MKEGEIKTLPRPALNALSLRSITHTGLTAEPLIQQVIFTRWTGRGWWVFKSKNKPLSYTAKYLLFKQKKRKKCIQHLWCVLEFNLNWVVFEALRNKELRWKCHQKSQTRFTHDCLHGFLSRFAYFKRCVSISKHRRAFNIDHYRARGLSEPLWHGWDSPEYLSSDVVTHIWKHLLLHLSFCQIYEVYNLGNKSIIFFKFKNS